MADKQLDAILETYNDKVGKLTKSYKEKKSKYKVEVIKKLEAYKKLKMQKGDLETANELQKKIKTIKGEPQESAAEANVAVGWDFNSTPPPPDSPGATKQEIRKFKRVRSPEDLHKALKKLNHSYQGNGRFETEDGRIVEVNLENCNIVNIAPLAGLKYAHTIELGGNPLWDLSPIKSLNLSGLSLHNTDVRDLEAVKNMKLHWLNISKTKIKNIAVVKKMPLTSLSMQACIFISDFTSIGKCKELEELILPPQALDMDIEFLKKLKKLRFIDTEWRDNKKPATQFWKEMRNK